MGTGDDVSGAGAGTGGGWSTGPPGDRFRYRVHEPEPLPGGRGYVFLATLGADQVALKLLTGLTPAGEERLRDRSARVSEHPHPNLAVPLELFRGPGLFQGTDPPGDDESDQLYASAEWVEGSSLRALAPLEPRAVGSMVVDLAEALTHLHEVCELVHRDIHPGNVILDRARATLIDLGAAGPDGAETTTIAGTLGFIAPERTHAPGDRRSDHWALGMVAVYALLGHPQGSQSVADLRAELLHALTGVTDPTRAADLLIAMVDPSPNERPAGLRRWAADLEQALEPATETRPEHSRALIAVGLLAAAAVGVGVGWYATGRRSDDRTVTPAATSTTTVEPVVTTETFGDATIVHTEGPDGTTITFEGPEVTVELTAAQLQSYQEIAGRSNPENAVVFGGYPVEVVPDEETGGFRIRLSTSGVILGERDDTIAFWMPNVVLSLWERHGGAHGVLGVPMSNPYFIEPQGMRQDFQRGFVVLDVLDRPFGQIDESQLRVELEASQGERFDGVETERTILRHTTGASWWVEDGERHWIRDGGTYQCLGGNDVVLLRDATGPEIAVFELGEPATCP